MIDENEPDVSDDRDIESLLVRMDVPFDIRVDWLAADGHEQGYYEYSDEIIELAKGKDDNKEEISIDIPISHNQTWKHF